MSNRQVTGRGARGHGPAGVVVLCLGLLGAGVLGCERPEPSAPARASEGSNGTEPVTSAVAAPEVPVQPAVAAPHPEPLPDYEAIVQSPERSADDRALDPGRKPAELLRLGGVKPGMRVAEIAAGGGYTAELLARVVGPSGKVYAQNTPFILERFAQVPWSARLEKPVMANVQRVDTEFDAPLPDDVRDLDVVFLVLFYHDMVWMDTDRAKFNRAIFDALAPGGVFVVVDHSAREGDGVTQAETLHRIEESVVVSEVTAAGFILDQSSDFLRQPDDARDWNASPRAAADRRGASDRFALRFAKPASSR